MRKRKCILCGKKLERRMGTNGRRPERPEHFAQRKTCGMICYGKRGSAEVPHKKCQECGKQMVKLGSEKRENFVKKKTCSDSCHRKFVSRTRREKFGSGQHSCSVCGKQLPYDKRWRVTCGSDECYKRSLAHKHVLVAGVEMTRQEAAQMFGVAFSTFCGWIKRGYNSHLVKAVAR